MELHQGVVKNALSNSLDFLDKFRDKIGEAYESVENQIDKTPWGYKLKKQVVESGGQEFRSTEPIKDFMKKSTGEQVARATAGLTTRDAQRALYKATNIPIIQQEILNDIPARVGVNTRDDKLAGAVITAGAPFLGAYLAGRAGGVGEGFRPKVEKAVYPKSKKEDPTGREVGNPLAEGIGRSVFFQRGQMLPYGEFKKERPDVMPSTYRDYMAYQYAKPEAGSLVSIDPKRGSFTAAAGLVRGSAKGLNDPEIRVKGFKVTASELGGMYAGTQAMKATMGFLGKQGTGAGEIDTSSFNPNISVKPEYTQTTAGGTKITDPRVQQIREEQLNKFVQDVKDDFTSQNRTLQQGMKIAGDRLQGVQATEGRSVLPKNRGGRNVNPTELLSGTAADGVTPGYAPRVSQSSKEIRGKNIVDSGPKPYNEYRVGIKSEQDPAKRAILQDALGQAKQESAKRLKAGIEDMKKNITTGQRIEAFLGGSQYRPYIAGAVGVAAALGTGYAIKKTAQKINERRVKKQDPVEYLKYKHGDFASAKKALNQPKAKGYQDLVPYVK